MSNPNAPHRLTAMFNNLDSIGQVWSLDGNDTPTMFSCMSASGPIAPIYTDNGPITVGQTLTLPYNYDTDEYANQNGGWACTVVRINRKTVTVKSHATGKSHRIEFSF